MAKVSWLLVKSWLNGATCAICFSSHQPVKRNFSGMLKRNFPRHPICQWVKGRTNSETVLPSHWASCGLCWGPTSLHDYMYETWMWSGKINVKFFKAAPDDGEWKSTYGTACQAESNMSKHVRHSFETYQKTRMRVFLSDAGSIIWINNCLTAAKSY